MVYSAMKSLLPALFMLLALQTSAHAAATYTTYNCEGYAPENPTPLQTGPLTLASYSCLPLPSTYFSRSVPTPSPDGKSFFAYDSKEGLWVGASQAKEPLHNTKGEVRGDDNVIPFTWAADSKTVLGVTQKTTRSGFSLGPYKPTLFGTDGTNTPLPGLNHPAGPLDELYWAGNNGLAIAAFGTQGGYYQPEHEDPSPTIALVNARTGNVLQATPIATIPGLTDEDRIARIATRRDATGRIHALMLFNHSGAWVSWVQGQKPQVVSLNPWWAEWLSSVVNLRTDLMPFILTPDAKHVLIMKNLSAVGPICEFNTKCPAPTAQSGMVAELREIATGKQIWTVQGTATEHDNSTLPAISPDGRYALISLPYSGKPYTLALISMASGKTLQHLPNRGAQGFGFSEDGKTVWVGGLDDLTLYTFKP